MDESERSKITVGYPNPPFVSVETRQDLDLLLQSLGSLRPVITHDVEKWIIEVLPNEVVDERLTDIESKRIALRAKVTLFFDKLALPISQAVQRNVYSIAVAIEQIRLRLECAIIEEIIRPERPHVFLECM